MRVVSPSAEIITEPNPLKRIELCGRVCYKSEDKITNDSAERFVAKIIERGHTSVLEHARLLLTGEEADTVINRLSHATGVNNTARLSRVHGKWDRLTINVRDYIALVPETPVAELASLTNADDYMTVRFVCDRAIANELVRHRVFSFSQESTRYVSYRDGLTFVAPIPYEDRPVWFAAMENAEYAYLALSEEGCSPQEARNVLPLSTKTELIMTGTIPQWNEMLRLRCAASAHPQMRYLMTRLVTLKDFPKELKDTVK